MGMDVRCMTPDGQPRPVRVWLMRMADRSNLSLQWLDPYSGRRRTRSAGTADRRAAEAARSLLEVELNAGTHQEPGDEDVVSLVDTVSLLAGASRSHVYFIRQLPAGPIKIGHATDVGKRRTGIEVGSPCDVGILGVIPGGGRDLEREIHACFRRARIKGEWFRPSASLLAFIARHAVPYEPCRHDPRPTISDEAYERAVASLFAPQGPGGGH